MIRSKISLAAVLACLAAAVFTGTNTYAATYTAQEQANMKVVVDFYAALDRGGAAGDLKQKIRAIAEQYLRPDYTQHAAAMQAFGPGREGFVRMFEQMPVPPGAAGQGPPPPANVLALMADGDLVVRISSRSAPGLGGKRGSDTFTFNMFRVQGGKLAEHWDASSGAGMLPNHGAPPGAIPPRAPASDAAPGGVPQPHADQQSR
jgi:predicted SnoaL-like aldol condensation-catalyzing enzyme